LLEDFTRVHRIAAGKKNAERLSAFDAVSTHILSRSQVAFSFT
jgi:hypothetical protein